MLKITINVCLFDSTSSFQVENRLELNLRIFNSSNYYTVHNVNPPPS